MTLSYTALLLCLFTNAAIAFFIAFYWQAKVILVLLATPDPRKAFGLFLSGGPHQELRRKWGKAIAYVAVSYVLLFGTIFYVEDITPRFFG
jgi:hypothetical protein